MFNGILRIIHLYGLYGCDTVRPLPRSPSTVNTSLLRIIYYILFCACLTFHINFRKNCRSMYNVGGTNIPNFLHVHST